MQAHNASTQETETGESQVVGQSVLYLKKQQDFECFNIKKLYLKRYVNNPELTITHYIHVLEYQHPLKYMQLCLTVYMYASIHSCIRALKE